MSRTALAQPPPREPVGGRGGCVKRTYAGGAEGVESTHAYMEGRHMPISPLGGVAPQFYLGLLKGRPRLTISG